MVFVGFPGGWSFVEPLQLATRGLHGVMVVYQGVGLVKETEQVLRGARESRLRDSAVL